MFPLSITGSIKLQAISPQQVSGVVASIVAALERERASNVSIIGNTISFRAGVFRFVSRWNVLVPVASGTLEVKAGAPGSIVFRFSCIQFLAIFTTIVLILGLALPSEVSTVSHLVIPLVAWLWLFGMNYLIAAIRLPSFVRRAAEAANRQ